MERREGPEGAHHGRCRRHGSHRASAVNPCWRKPSPDVVCDFTGFMAEPMKEITKEIVDKAKKKKKWGRWKVSRYGSWRNSGADRQHTGGIHGRRLGGGEHGWCFRTGAGR